VIICRSRPWSIIPDPTLSIASTCNYNVASVAL
jgi:hypothetical protein